MHLSWTDGIIIASYITVIITVTTELSFYNILHLPSLTTIPARPQWRHSPPQRLSETGEVVKVWFVPVVSPSPTAASRTLPPPSINNNKKINKIIIIKKAESLTFPNNAVKKNTICRTHTHTHTHLPKDKQFGARLGQQPATPRVAPSRVPHGCPRWPTALNSPLLGLAVRVRSAGKWFSGAVEEVSGPQSPSAWSQAAIHCDCTPWTNNSRRTRTVLAYTYIPNTCVCMCER